MLGFGKDKKAESAEAGDVSSVVDKTVHKQVPETEKPVNEAEKKGFFGKLFGRKKEESEALVSEASAAVPDEIVKHEPVKQEDRAGQEVVPEEAGRPAGQQKPAEAVSSVETSAPAEQISPQPSGVPASSLTEPALIGNVEQASAGREPSALSDTEPALAESPAIAGQEQSVSGEQEKAGIFSRIKKGLGKTGSVIAEGVGSLVLGKKVIDDELMEELETRLLMADVGIDATTEVIEKLAKRVARKQLDNADALYEALKETLFDMLVSCEQPLQLSTHKPFVLLVVGVNGVGKTTTIGKMARQFQRQGKSVLLAAGDTFRAAAVEQLQVWGERNDVPVVAQHTGADSASVIFDAVAAARSRNIDIVIADTAGRLHNKSNLMEELKKVSRVIGKLDDTAPHEVLLVLDAGTGQNAISQAEQFQQAVNVTGIALTKLDGTAKGGVIFALCKRLGLPVRYVGVGEGVEDLQVFNARRFVDALFASVSESEKKHD
ncbi:MAG: signal recognition particle-docking protein FtsY [Pseudomonadales bacterium]|nr:signal recognition particle-docking protein FtsY [Pseudomonadales bacterium]